MKEILGMKENPFVYDDLNKIKEKSFKQSLFLFQVWHCIPSVHPSIHSIHLGSKERLASTNRAPFQPQYFSRNLKTQQLGDVFFGGVLFDVHMLFIFRWNHPHLKREAAEFFWLEGMEGNMGFWVLEF